VIIATGARLGAWGGLSVMRAHMGWTVASAARPMTLGDATVGAVYWHVLLVVSDCDKSAD
jgi:hypothetical protein